MDFNNLPTSGSIQVLDGPGVGTLPTGGFNIGGFLQGLLGPAKTPDYVPPAGAGNSTLFGQIGSSILGMFKGDTTIDLSKIVKLPTVELEAANKTRNMMMFGFIGLIVVLFVTAKSKRR